MRTLKLSPRSSGRGSSHISIVGQEVRACWDHPHLRRRVKSEPGDPKYLIQTLPSQCLHMQISTHSEGSHSPLKTSAAGRAGAPCQVTTKSPPSHHQLTRGAELAGGALSFSVRWESTVRSPIAGRHLLQPLGPGSGHCPLESPLEMKPCSQSLTSPTGWRLPVCSG